jgi:hypothetical protein
MSYRALEAMNSLMLTVLDQRYIQLQYTQDTIKARVLDQEWWKSLEKTLRLVWPYVKVIKFADGDKVPRSPQAITMLENMELYFENALDSYNTGGNAEDDDMFNLAMIIHDCRLARSQSNVSYLELMKNDIVLAAHVMNHEIQSTKPWQYNGAMDAVQHLFYKWYNQEEVSCDVVIAVVHVLLVYIDAKIIPLLFLMCTTGSFFLFNPFCSRRKKPWMFMKLMLNLIWNCGSSNIHHLKVYLLNHGFNLM